MKIEESVKTLTFGSLDDGDVFRSGTKYFLKIPPCESSGYEYNAYDLTIDDYIYFRDDKEVIPVNAKLVIE